MQSTGCRPEVSRLYTQKIFSTSSIVFVAWVIIQNTVCRHVWDSLMCNSEKIRDNLLNHQRYRYNRKSSRRCHKLSRQELYWRSFLSSSSRKLFPSILGQQLLSFQRTFWRRHITGKHKEINCIIAWLITLQRKIPVTAGPINPKLPSNLKSARLQIFTNFTILLVL